MLYTIKHAPPNPTIEYAQGAMEDALLKGATAIESIGGGSTIDVAKWVAKRLRLRHTAIPTTAGTGSEVTRFVVLTVDGKKTTFTDNAYIPDSYILDPRRVVSLPRLHTISSGLDALSQCVESLWSTKANALSAHYSEFGMKLIIASLLESLENPTDERLRMDMLIAANCSGRAINITRTNVCHAISYPLTDWYGIPHGIACAMSLGYFANKLKISLDWLIKPILPEYKIDAWKVAKHVINSEKLLDYPLPITVQDIYNSLNGGKKYTLPDDLQYLDPGSHQDIGASK